MGVHLAGSPPHQQCAEWAWETEWGSTQQQPISLSAQRHSAKAVCESLCRLLLRGFHHFPSAPEPWRGGSSFQPQHRSCSLSPYTSHESAWVTQQLAVAQAILCSSHRDLGGSRLFACKPVTTAFTYVQGQGEATQLCLWCSVHATLSRAGPVHDAAHLLHRNAIPQFNSLVSKCSLSRGGWWEKQVPLLHVTTLHVGNGSCGRARGCCSLGPCFVFFQVATAGRSAGGNLWASYSWLKSPAHDWVPSAMVDWLRFSFLTPCDCCQPPRLSTCKPAAFPTVQLLTAHQSSIATQHPCAGVVYAVSTVLTYMLFSRAFLLGAQELRVQILPPSTGSWPCSGLLEGGVLQKSWVPWSCSHIAQEKPITGTLLIAEVSSYPHFPLVLQSLENHLVSAGLPNCFLVFIQNKPVHWGFLPKIV